MHARIEVAVATVSCLLPALLLAMEPAYAASFDCSVPRLKAAQIVVCTDTELSQTDDRTARRVRGLQRRLGFGFYLGVRYWQARSSDQRDACESSRPCIVSAYRAQNRTIDRLIACLESSSRRRSCLRVTLSSETTAAKRAP